MISPQALQFAQALRARSAQQPFQGTPWADPPRPQPMQPQPQSAMPQQPIQGVAMSSPQPTPPGYTPMAPPPRMSGVVQPGMNSPEVFRQKMQNMGYDLSQPGVPRNAAPSANPRGYTPRPAQPQGMAPRAPVNPLRLM